MFNILQRIKESVDKLLGKKSIDDGLGLSLNDWRRIDSHNDYLKRQARSGRKLSRKAFEGRLGLRGRTLSGATLMAQQGNLGDAQFRNFWK